MTLTLSALDRAAAAYVDPLPLVSLVGATCPRCGLQVLVVRVGDERMPVLLEVASVTVVADSGRVLIGHPLHDAGICLVRDLDQRAQAEAADESKADARWERHGVLPKRMGGR